MTDLPEVQYCRLPSGYRLAWREWGVGAPLIMLHGWSMSSAVFSEVARSLSDHCRVLAPDLPGHGYSDPLPVCRLAGFAAAITQWAGQLGLPAAMLLGWSLGGQVALQIAAAERMTLQKLLLISTTPLFCQAADWRHGLPATEVKALDRNLGRAYEKTMGEFFNLQFDAGEISKQRYRQIIAFAVRSSRLPQPAVAREALKLLGSADLRSCLTDIELSTLVMHGERDRIVPFSAAEYLASQLPHARLCPVPAVGHAPFFSYPEESVRQWLNFLS